MDIHSPGQRIFGGVTYTIAAAANAIVDVRGASGLVAYSATGTATAQPCDATGTALSGAAAAALTMGTKLEAAAHYYKVTASTAEVTVLVIG